VEVRWLVLHQFTYLEVPSSAQQLGEGKTSYSLVGNCICVYVLHVGDYCVDSVLCMGSCTLYPFSLNF
jgi:hypothetical protein